MQWNNWPRTQSIVQISADTDVDPDCSQPLLQRSTGQPPERRRQRVSPRTERLLYCYSAVVVQVEMAVEVDEDSCSVAVEVGGADGVAANGNDDQLHWDCSDYSNDATDLRDSSVRTSAGFSIYR